MDLASIRSEFTGIRVHLQWSLLSGCAVKTEIVTAREHLGRLWSPWYVSPFGKQTSFYTLWARPISIPEVHDLLPHKRSVIADLMQSIARSGSIEIDVPAYDIGKARRLVLDRNHTLSALHRSAVPFTVRLHVIEGPIDQAILPDLRHWRRR